MMESSRWGTNIFWHYWNNLYIQTWSNILLNYYQILKERNSSAMQKITTPLANKWTFICAAVISDLCHCQVLFNLGEFDNLIGYCCCEKNPYLLIQMVSVSEIKSRHTIPWRYCLYIPYQTWFQAVWSLKRSCFVLQLRNNLSQMICTLAPEELCYQHIFLRIHRSQFVHSDKHVYSG